MVWIPSENPVSGRSDKTPWAAEDAALEGVQILTVLRRDGPTPH